MSETIRMVSGPEAYQPRKGLATFTIEHTKWVDVFTKQETGIMLLQAMSAEDPALRSRWLACATEWSKSRE